MEVITKRPGRKKGVPSRTPAQMITDLESEIQDLENKYLSRREKLAARLSSLKQKATVHSLISSSDPASLEAMSPAELLEHAKALAMLVTKRR